MPDTLNSIQGHEMSLNQINETFAEKALSAVLFAGFLVGLIALF
jgi:hypothetical protein